MGLPWGNGRARRKWKTMVKYCKNQINGSFQPIRVKGKRGAKDGWTFKPGSQKKGQLNKRNREARKRRKEVDEFKLWDIFS